MEEKQQCGSIKKEALLKDRRERAHSKAHTDKKEDQGTSKDVYRIPPRAKIHSAHGQCSQQRDTDPQASNEKVMQKEDRTELCEEHSAFEETAASLQYPGAVRIRGFCPESAWDEMSYERSDEDGSASQTIGAAENPITVVAEVVKEDLEISQIRERMQVNETKNANKEDSGQFRGCRFLSISIGLLVVGAIVGVVLGVTLGREGNEGEYVRVAHAKF